MSIKVTLLDPALKNNNGDVSDNLGDFIIFQSVYKHLQQIFPHEEIIRISTHSYWGKREREILQESELIFLGGSNLLSSDIRKYNQWKSSNKKLYYLFPEVKKIINYGTGWWQYQASPTLFTRFFYRGVFDASRFHSVRDNYTKEKLETAGLRFVLNTSCPTTWDLNGLNPNRKNLLIKNCLFTLTDYNRNIDHDNDLIDILLEHYSGQIYYFPQGSKDKEYIDSLPSFRNNKSRIQILHRSIDAFLDVINAEINYVGTRLHGGIKCLQNSMDALIVSVDNRATEIGRDINLPVVERGDRGAIINWIIGKSDYQPTKLPIQSIDKWKDQFR